LPTGKEKYMEIGYKEEIIFMKKSKEDSLNG
jgi:hypothetical protein